MPSEKFREPHRAGIEFIMMFHRGSLLEKKAARNDRTASIAHAPECSGASHVTSVAAILPSGSPPAGWGS